MKSIFLFAPAAVHDTVDLGPIAYAIGLAQAQGASLTALSVALDVTTPGQTTDAVAAGQAIVDAAAAKGVETLLVTEHSHAVGIHEVVAGYARLHDVTVAGCASDGMVTERAIVEHVLFASGRPVIAVPADYSGVPAHENLVVAWDDTRGAARAMADAQALFDAKSAILLTIDGEKTLLPVIDADSTLMMLGRRGLAATSALRSLNNRPIADAIQEEAAALGADMLVMGAFGHSRLRHYLLGSATGGLFGALRMPTLLSH